MLTALIAEDELLVKIGISSCVPWAELNVAVVGEASDGTEAWELFQKYRPDIIILDLLMPGLNGIELLQRIRAVDRHCAVIVVTNVGEEDLLEEVQQLGVTQILPKISMKRDDISAAVRRACEAITSETGDTAAQAEDEKRVLEKLLFGSDGQDAPFEVRGMTGIRLFPEEYLTPALKRSLSTLALQKLGDANAYVLLSQEGGQLLVWKEMPQGNIAEGALMDFAHYVRDNLHVNMGVASAFGAIEGAQLPRMARRLAALLHEPRLFDYPVVLLDANGGYINERLNDLRSALAICVPMCAEQDEINALKNKLDRYPGTLEEGFERVLENASDLLASLDLSTAQTGLWEMTRNICVRMEDRVSRIIGRIRPEIRRTMAYIQAHLREKLSREQLSSLVSFGDTYFSRIFKAEVGMSYTDYLLRARMLAAQDLLRSTDMPISEIAGACGFYDASYFIVQYREFYGETPREWRKKNGETKA